MATKGGQVTLRDVYDLVKDSESRTQAAIQAVLEKLDNVDCRVDDVEQSVAILQEREGPRARLQVAMATALAALAVALGGWFRDR